jgi:hypothetical protein
MLPSEARKLRKQKLESQKNKVHKKISNSFIESAIKRNTLNALKTIYYIANAVESISDLNTFDNDKLLTITFDTREMLKYTNMTLPSIKKNIKAMQQTSIVFYDEVEDTETGVSLLPYYKFLYGKNRVEIKLFVRIAKEIIDVKRNYSMIDTSQLMKLKSKHTLKLLPLLMRISQYGKEVAKRKTFDLNALNEFFGTKYKKFYEIERKILKPIQEELDSSESKLSFIYETNYDYFDAGRPKAISITIDVIKK